MEAQGRSSYTWVYFVVFGLSLIVFGFGVYLAASGLGYAMLAAGSVSLVGVLLIWPLALGTAYVGSDKLMDARFTSLTDQFGKINAALTLIAEQQLISDRAKQVAFREKDRDAFRRAIQEDLSNQDYEAALALVDKIESSFGYKDEADRSRSEIIDRRDAAIRRQVDAAMVLLERYCETEQWQAAFKEAERLRGLFPSVQRVQSLPGEIEQRRLVMKKQLLARFHENARTNRIDDAISCLKRLDLYLTPVEASTIEEEARVVFREKMNLLRTDFTNSIQAGRTADAIRTGETIMNDFPNTQMAREIRERMEILKGRLRTEQVSASGVGSPV